MMLVKVFLFGHILVGLYLPGDLCQETPECGIWGMPCPKGPCGGFTCGENARCKEEQECGCLPGYGRPCTDRTTAIITCSDIDECRTGTHRCPRSQSRCENAPGGYTCVPYCRPGYGNVGTGAIGAPLICRDINECSTRSLRQACDVDARCENTIGSFRCTCLSGYTGNGRSCQDINECRGQNQCHIQATCVNIEGSYNCICNEGYEGDGRNCVLSRVAEGENECLQEGSCHANATCVNTRGSYSCSCRRGFTGNGIDSCEDIDECQDSSTCHHNATCTNVLGSYQCACRQGFSGDGTGSCEEVTSGCDVTDICHGDADCIRTEGRSTCQCAEGYSGDGVHSCIDINECELLGTSACGPGNICANSKGSFNCTCVGDTCSGVNIGSTEIAFNDRTLEFFGIGFAIFSSLLLALILGWLIRRKRRRQSPLFEEENPADNPHIDNNDVTVEPIEPEVSATVNASPEGLTPGDISPAHDSQAPSNVAEVTRPYGAGLSNDTAGSAEALIEAPRSGTERPTSLGDNALPDVITPNTLWNAEGADASHAGTSVQTASSIDNRQSADIWPTSESQRDISIGQSVSGASAGAAPYPQATNSPNNSALDATLPVIDEIEIWHGPAS